MQQPPQQERSPTEFLSNVIGRPVVVKLNSGVDYRGIFGFFTSVLRILSCLDGYMNIALEQTEEWVNGQLKNKYGDAFIRGNNVLYISADKARKREPLNIQ
ncbi:16376_t:CDS:2 [Cetraspora pellucida]|uniref:16376_t:CDS:1 n=1 Tax=Cetraspora pellucida TaxID=1433469 RepID=A0A9N9FEB1_9GLOM|nr:16376_t:CDS:2 [Cetraspora pellucida]